MQDTMEIMKLRDCAGMINLAGGKGASLGEMLTNDIPTADGYVVTAPATVDYFNANGLDDEINKIYAAHDMSDPDQLLEASNQIKEAIGQCPLPSSLRQQIADAYRELCGPTDQPVAVRSSATAEDLPDASFAGQQSSYTNVIGAEHVADAVLECIKSLFNVQAIQYRITHGFDHKDVAIAVVVQLMLFAEVSGVMFTIDAANGDTSITVVESVNGLGETQVAGLASPATYRINHDEMTVLDVTELYQTQKLVYDPEAEGGAEGYNRWVELVGDEQTRRPLSDEEVLELTRLGQRIKQHYGHDVDVEWVRVNREFRCTQVRPVTVMSKSFSIKKEPLPTITNRVLATGRPVSEGVGIGRVRFIPTSKEQHLINPGDVLQTEMTEPDYGPAMERSSAIITARGGLLCHAAVVSREIGVPAVVGIKNLFELVPDGTLVTVDGYHGVVYEGEVPELMEWHERFVVRKSQQHSDTESWLLSGEAPPTATKLMIIASKPKETEPYARIAQGVGLCRTELVLPEFGYHPRKAIELGLREAMVEHLAGFYRQFAQMFPYLDIFERTTDYKSNEYEGLIGAEEYEGLIREANPTIGDRGVGRYMNDPESFLIELDAVKRVRAEGYHNLHIMAPFVRTFDQWRWFLSFLAEHGLVRGENGLKIGMMVELPVNAIFLPRFYEIGLDFVSIGSNDLTQLTLGIDRENEKIQDQGNEMSEEMLLLIESIVRTAARLNLPCGICGMAPSNYPELVEDLIKWGITSISVMGDRIVDTAINIRAAEAKLGIAPQ